MCLSIGPGSCAPSPLSVPAEIIQKDGLGCAFTVAPDYSSWPVTEGSAFHKI